MKTYISILRGINVSGHNLIKMGALKILLTELGFINVRTYIQSGNVVFESTLPDEEKIALVISGGIHDRFGFVVPVIVFSHDYLESLMAKNRFLYERVEDILKLHITFLSREPAIGLSDAISRDQYLPDEFYIEGNAVFLFCPNGYGNTKLSNTFFEKKLKVQATTRNWKTILELARMTE